jgi:dihydrofolate synthase/folylpolyglutamate synthase
MKQQELLDFIYQRHSGNVKLGLERMFSMLTEMGNPHKKLPGIHIAGTNGKGSCAAMCEAMGLAHGLQTGLNTSPHLVEYNERIRINGIPVSYDEIMDVYSQWQPVFEKNEASFFEISTAFAFYLFDKYQLDFSIFEVGLGGRLDGTNPFQSTVTAITSISFDHIKSLGESLEEIAREKAGILKKEIPLVLGKLPQHAVHVILEKAMENNCEVFQFGKNIFAENIRFDTKGTVFDYCSSELELPNLTINLLGKHQASNAAVAIKSFELFQKKMNRTVNPELIRFALQKINWQGRMQIINHNPMVILDGAHNEEGIHVLVENLKAMFTCKRFIFVVAILRDKKLDAMLAELCSVSKLMLISKNNSTRAAELEEQVEIVKNYTQEFKAIYDIRSAVQFALTQAADDEVIVVCGSLYTIAEVLQNSHQTI